MREAWVISDLHLGDGKRPGLEDFGDDERLSKWLGDRGGPDNGVVINGDFVDFLQINVDVTPKGLPQDRLWDEATSIEKLNRSFLGHPKVFDALKSFVASGAELRFTIGNHDLDFGWPGVQEAMRKRLADKNDRIQFALQHMLFDRVHVEHGHRFTGENCPRDFTKFWHTFSQPDQPDVAVLECTWGSRFVLDALNPLEIEHPYIDNVKPTWKLAYHMLREGGWFQEGRAHALVQLIRFFRRAGIPLRDIVNAALSEEDEVDAANLENVFGEDEAAWRDLVRQIRAEEPLELIAAVNALSDEERTDLDAPRQIEIGEPEELDKAAADTIKHGERRPEAAAAQDLGLFRENREVRGAKDCLGEDGITHVVLGHTHEIVDGGVDKALFNPGSWIERLNIGSPMVTAKKGNLRDVLADAGLFSTDPRAVHVTLMDGKATVTLETVSV